GACRIDQEISQPAGLALAVQMRRDRDQRLQYRRLNSNDHCDHAGRHGKITSPMEIDMAGNDDIEPADGKHAKRPDRQTEAIACELAPGSLRHLSAAVGKL